MPRSPKPAPDLSLIEFRHALADHGFCYLGASADRYVDIRYPKPGRYIEPVKDTRKRIRRQATLERLLAARKTVEREAAAIAAERRRREEIAARIAPRAFQVCRAALSGPDAIAQLADDLIVASTRAEGVVKADLVLIGWQPEQLREHADAARTLAYRRQDGVAA